MAARPRFHKDFGEYLVGLREKLGWTQSDAARYAKRQQLRGLTRNVILRLEDGLTKNPDPDVLRSLARLYAADVLGEFVRARYGVTPSTIVHFSGHGKADLSTAVPSTEKKSYAVTTPDTGDRVKGSHHMPWVEHGTQTGGILDTAQHPATRYEEPPEASAARLEISASMRQLSYDLSDLAERLVSPPFGNGPQQHRETVPRGARHPKNLRPKPSRKNRAS